MGSVPKEFEQELRQKALATGIEGQKGPAKFWITTTSGMSGYFAVMMWNDGEMDEPWETGMDRYKTKSEAETEGRKWAEDEGLEFR